MPASRETILSTTAVIEAEPVGRLGSDGKSLSRTLLLAQTMGVEENVNRFPVNGIGDFYLRDAPALGWGGMLTLDFYAASFIEHPTGAVIRNWDTAEKFKQWHTYFKDAVVITLMDNRIANNVSAANFLENGNASVEGAEVLMIKDARWVNDGFDMPNQSVASRRTSFMYLEPIISDNKNNDYRNLLSTNVNDTGAGHVGDSATG